MTYLRKNVHVMMVFVGHLEFALDCRASHRFKVNSLHL